MKPDGGREFAWHVWYCDKARLLRVEEGGRGWQGGVGREERMAAAKGDAGGCKSIVESRRGQWE